MIARLAASLGVVLATTAVAAAAPRGVTFRRACSPARGCHALVAVGADGRVLAANAPQGLVPADLVSAYHLDPTLGDGITIAVVDAFGYAALESDLAVYRQTFGLPACTIASGCLTILNQDGNTSPLPADDNDWIQETSLDVQAVSAVCPKCKIVVVQTNESGQELELGQKEAITLPVAAISDSWSEPEFPGIDTAFEQYFGIPGVGTFASTADSGFNDMDPQYPSTSNGVIAVGGTNLSPDLVHVGGWIETAWTDAGSSCSTIIPKPSYQPASAKCAKRAASDLSAVADPNTGLSVYVAQFGGWTVVGGTSLASPVVMAMMAAAGHGDATPAFVYKHPEVYRDVTAGSNGTCGTNLCDAGSGWDGPTGLGTPDQRTLVAIGNSPTAGPELAISFPSNGETVAAGFSVDATAGSDALYATLTIDGARAGTQHFPASFTAPANLPDGAHTLVVTAFDVDHNYTATTLTVMQGAGSGSGVDSSSGGGGCAAGGSGGGLVGVGLLGVGLARRRRARSAA